MRFRSTGYGFLAAVLLAGTVQAAPATPEEALSIRHALERYLGSGNGGAGPVTVTPEGEAYRVAIDVKAMLQGLQRLGVTVAPMTYTVAVVPQGDGTWRVSNGGQMLLSTRYGGQTFDIAVNGLKSDGIFDPKIPAFITSSTTYDSTSVASTDGKGATQTREQRQGRQELSSSPHGDGVVDAHLNQTSAGIFQDLTVAAPQAGTKLGALTDIALKTGATATTASVDSLHIRALTDLWAFAVAHPSPQAVQAAQSELRDLLRQALPLFAHWTQDGSAKDVAVTTPVGLFTAQAVFGRIDLTGLTADGRAELQSKVDGLAIPAGLVPGWAAGLLPDTVDIKERFSGYRLDTAAAEFINSFDLTKADLLPPGAVERIKALVGPLDQMVLTFPPSRIASKQLDLRFEGDVRFALPMPDVHATLHATGLDGAIQDIQAKAGADPSAAQLVAVLVMAKGYGKAEPDGSLTWVITKTATGGVLVNGVALPIGQGR